MSPKGLIRSVNFTMMGMGCYMEIEPTLRDRVAPERW